MPIYEYVCRQCDNEFDALRPMSESDAPIPCVHCNGENTERKISLFAAHSDGRVVAGSNTCSSCQSTSCATCSH
jgi:putative FmdB family regulatory protein